MSKICAKCSKAVYPLEELKCLDKVWHKGCFKCWECGMTLSMKNYKGYDKKPYCVAHYPQTKATVVADTPEMARIAHNTKIQSQIKYHEEFEKMKGSKIEVADDPELRRVKRIGSVVSQIEYKGQNKADVRRPSLQHSAAAEADNSNDHKPSPYSDRSVSHSTVYSSVGGKVAHAPVVKRIGSIADYDPVNENFGSLTHGYHPTSRSNSMTQEWEETVPISPSLAVGRDFADEASVPEGGEDTFTEEAQDVTVSLHVPVTVLETVVSETHDETVSSQEGDNELGPAVADIDKSIVEETFESTEDQVEQQHDDVTPESSNAEVADSSEGNAQETASDYRALFSYSAQDDDEVSFEEGDVILNVEIIDEGWMVGTVQRTSIRGMMPSNYCEIIE